MVDDPALVVAPFLVLAGTDARHYEPISAATYRFLPVTITDADRSRFHGLNERIAVDAYATAIRFYYQLIRNATS